MTDTTLVREILRNLGIHHGYLVEDSACSREEFLGDRRVYQPVERNLEIAAQCCIDIGMHIIAWTTSLRSPRPYRSISRDMTVG